MKIDIYRSPCFECICIPICKNKYYINLFRQCKILSKYLPNYTDATARNKEKLINIFNQLKPNAWGLKYDKSFNIYFVIRGGE
jgi:hypothetical protein